MLVWGRLEMDDTSEEMRLEIIVNDRGGFPRSHTGGKSGGNHHDGGRLLLAGPHVTWPKAGLSKSSLVKTNCQSWTALLPPTTARSCKSILALLSCIFLHSASYHHTER